MRYHVGMARWLVVLALAACSKTNDESSAGKWQAGPPPAKQEVPADLVIRVEVDGVPKPAITRQTLDATKPDFVDVEHRIWLVPTLVPDAVPGAMVEATAPSGMSIKLAHPSPDGFEPALFLSRRGEVKVAAIDPKEPFPKWHGQGGRVHRAGDALPHVGPVAKLAITRPPTL